MRITLFAAASLLLACSSGSTGDYVYDFGGGGAPAGSSSPAPSGAAAAADGGASAGPSANGGTPAGSTPASGGTPASSSTGSFDVALDKSASKIDLMASDTVKVTLTPTAGFTGTVALAATGLPGQVAAAFDKPAIDLSTGPATVNVTLTSQSTATPGTSSLQIVATAGARSISKPLALTIDARVTVTISANAFSPSPLVLVLGNGPIAVRMHNGDTVGHTIHADNAQQGFAHGNEIDPGTDEGNTQAGVPRTVNAKTTYDYYLHDDSSVRGRIIVQ